MKMKIFFGLFSRMLRCAERMQRLVKRKIGSQESGDYVILYLDTGKQQRHGGGSAQIMV